MRYAAGVRGAEGGRARQSSSTAPKSHETTVMMIDPSERAAEPVDLPPEVEGLGEPRRQQQHERVDDEEEQAERQDDERQRQQLDHRRDEGVAPGLMGWCVGQMGFERQLTREPGACALQEMTLFKPSQRVFTVHGPFGRRARGWSIQLWLEGGLSAAGNLLGRGWRGATSSALWPARRAPKVPDPKLGGLAARPDDF